VVTNGDDALVGRLLGLDLLGYYAMAYAIANLPVTSLCETLGRISFPVYSQMQDDRERVQEVFKKIFESALMILLPLTALIMMLAEDFIAVFLGDRWLPMAGVLRVLCLLGLFRGLSNVIAPVHLAVNRPEIPSRNKTVELVVFALLIYPLTTRWGLIGAGWAVSAVYLVGLILNAEALSRLLKDVPQIIYTALRCPLAATTGMVLSALLAGTVSNGLAPLLRFFLSGFAAVAAFLLIAEWMNHGVIMDVYRRMTPKKCGDIRT
jgi:O-antigen/teichoic acid export membrane protein